MNVERLTHRLNLRLDLSAGVSHAVAAALDPELGSLPLGTRAALSTDGAVLEVEIEATDLWALRTAMHGLLRLVQAAALTP